MLAPASKPVAIAAEAELVVTLCVPLAWNLAAVFPESVQVYPDAPQAPRTEKVEVELSHSTAGFEYKNSCAFEAVLDMATVTTLDRYPQAVISSAAVIFPDDVASGVTVTLFVPAPDAMLQVPGNDQL